MAELPVRPVPGLDPRHRAHGSPVRLGVGKRSPDRCRHLAAFPRRTVRPPGRIAERLPPGAAAAEEGVVVPVPTRSGIARAVRHRGASLAAARAAFPLPYPEVTTPAEPPPAGASPASAAHRPRPEPLPPLPPNAAMPPIRTSVRDLLALARQGLAEATGTTSPPDRYASAHLSALRCAAAVIAACAVPAPAAPARRTRPLSAWVLLAALAPELREWAAFFAAGAAKRAAAEARMPGAVTAREADDLLRDAETFLAVVETKLGGAARPSLLDRSVG